MMNGKHIVKLKLKENNSVLKLFYIKRWNSVQFNSTGFFYSVRSIAKVPIVMPVQEQGKKSKTHRNRELNKKKTKYSDIKKTTV